MGDAVAFHAEGELGFRLVLDEDLDTTERERAMSGEIYMLRERIRQFYFRHEGMPGGPAIWTEVQAERERAHAKHGEMSMDLLDPLDPFGVRRDVITEEWGEVAREYNDARHEGRGVDPGRLRKELIQVAVVAGAWADALTPLVIAVERSGS